MSLTVPTKQTALVVPIAQAPFEIQEIDVVKPSAGEVLVRAESIGLNPIDWLIQEQDPFKLTYPMILGCEAAGTVVQLGEGVTSLAVGDQMSVIQVSGKDGERRTDRWFIWSDSIPRGSTSIRRSNNTPWHLQTCASRYWLQIYSASFVCFTDIVPLSGAVQPDRRSGGIHLLSIQHGPHWALLSARQQRRRGTCALLGGRRTWEICRAAHHHPRRVCQHLPIRYVHL